MNKKNFVKGGAIVLFALMTLLYACQKTAETPARAQTIAETTDQPVSLLSVPTVLQGKACGTPLQLPLVNTSEETPATLGSVEISNDETNLYVRYDAALGYDLKQIRIFVGDASAAPSSDDIDNGTNDAQNPVFGQFYKPTDFTNATYTYILPLVSLKGQCVKVMAFAQLQAVTKGKALKAWAAGTPNGGKNPSYYVDYCLQSCETTAACYDNESAWAAGKRYVTKGNWATYTPTPNNGKEPVTIYAGQTMAAGTASFSAPDIDGNVTITIKLAAGWSLTSDNESVKIQGYIGVPPAKNPAPGQFTTYKGNALTITVPKFEYYGIHLDVRRVVPCP
ncbi:hypothetical protein [Niabella hirudinis]|uniref:hypothetical protein n=1 Tax=Niabella hirudinis TaxID=1285929 RepID=UPI003EB7E86C